MNNEEIIKSLQEQLGQPIINRKKVEFYKKEKNIVREMVLSPNGLEQDLCFDSPIKVTLRIKNISDTTYSYSYVYRASS